MNKTIYDTCKGDTITGSQNEVEVLADYEVHHPERMYEIELENGEIIRCSGNHLWYAETDIDRKEKWAYKKLALDYFESHGIPKLLEVDQNLPIIHMLNTLGDIPKEKQYILKCCNTLGHCAYTRTIEVSGLGLNEIKKEVDIALYSVNDIITFISHMKESLVNDKGYFYFGSTYMTDTLFSGFTPEEINIPTVHDIRQALIESKANSTPE